MSFVVLRNARLAVRAETGSVIAMQRCYPAAQNVRIALSCGGLCAALTKATGGRRRAGVLILASSFRCG